MERLLRHALSAIGVMPPTTRKGGRTLPHEARAQLLLRYVVLRRALRGVAKKLHTTELPDELTFKIFAYAGFVATVEVSTTERCHGRDRQDDCYLQMKLPARAFRLFAPTSVTFQVSSHDQGWTSEPGPTGERNSFTWGEAAVLPHVLTPPPPPLGEGHRMRHFIYRNRRACAEVDHQTVTFGEGTPLVQALVASAASVAAAAANDGGAGGGTQPGEVVVELHLRSAYPGWAHHAHRGRISVTWALTEAVLIEENVDALWARPPAPPPPTAALRGTAR